MNELGVITSGGDKEMMYKSRLSLILCFILNFILLQAYLYAETVEPKTTKISDITIEEYKLAKNAECFDLNCIPEHYLKKREKWRDRSHKSLFAEINEQLKGLGFRFAKKDQINTDFYKGTKLLYSNLQNIRGFNLNSSKTRFIFIADHNKPARTETDVVFLDGKIVDLPVYHGHGPLFLADKLIYLSPIENSSNQETFEYVSMDVNKETVDIYLDDKVIYRFDFIGYPFDRAIQQFYVHNNHWVIEFMKAEVNGKKVKDYHGTVIVDGLNLNERYKEKEIFNYIYIKDKPFYFFKDKTGNTQIKYAGVTLPLKYNEVKHYGCCSYSAFNPDWSDNMIWFYGVKDNHLYYVEAGGYD